MKNSVRGSRVAVSADGRGLVSQAGAVLLWETMRVTGLGRGLSQGLAQWRAPRAVHDPGKIVMDLAAALALGGTAWPTSPCCGSRCLTIEAVGDPVTPARPDWDRNPAGR